MAGLGFVQPATASHSIVAAVTGSAFGYWSDDILLFSSPQPDIGPMPTVALAADASNSPQHASATTGRVAYGPARLFTSDGITVDSSGSLGSGGLVTSTSNIQNINYADTQADTGSEVFGYPPPEPAESPYINFNPDSLRTSVSGTATASPSGVRGSTTVTDGIVRTHKQSSEDCTPPLDVEPCGRPGEEHTHSSTDPEGVVTIPTNPPPNYVVPGHLHLGSNTTDYFVIVFNEQIVNLDGSITVNPVHEYFGNKYINGQIVPDASSLLHGHLYLGQVTAGAIFTPGVPEANVAPVASDDSYGTDEDSPLTVAAPGVLGNDSDSDGGTLSAGSASDPANGSVTLNADGSFAYTPDANFSGSDTFTYTTSDGHGGTDDATVTIAVAAVNDVPVAVDDSYGTDEDTPLVVAAPAVLGNDTDAEGDALTAGSASTPAHGTLSLNANGSFTYTPTANNYYGHDSFTYTVNDGQGGTDTATVVLYIAAENDAPVAGDDADTTAAGTVLTVNGPGVLGNDTDVDSLCGLQPDGGPACAGGGSLSAGSPSDPAGGSVTLNADGSFTYTPDAGFSGADSFNYTVSDEFGATDTATVTITVTPPPPIGDIRPTQLSVGDVSVAEGNSGTTAVTFTVNRLGDLSGSSTVKYRTSGGTATASTDYTALALSTLSFAAGEGSKTVSVDLAGDNLPEKDETLNLVLSTPTGAVIADASGTATVVNDDGTAYLGANSVTVTEGNDGTTPATFTVTRSGNTAGASSVKYRTATGTAGAEDFTAVSLTTLDFAPGETAKTVTVDVTGDTGDEKNETFTLALSAPVGAVVSDAAGTATVVDDEGTITPGPATFISVADLWVTEGSPSTFTLTRSGDTSVASSVKYRTSGGTATAGTDYTALPLSTVSFGPGETTKTVTVEVAGDTLPEKDETVTLMLSSPTGAVTADASGTATLLNDDGAAYLAVDNVSVTEGNSGSATATFTVTRSGNTNGASTLKYRTTNGTAAAGSDYTAVDLTTLGFEPGETSKTITVGVTGDTTVEKNETLNVVLSTPVGAIISDASGTATVVNDD